jgi:excisionase family DNA binding protein
MDTSERISVETPKQITRRRRSVQEKRRIVEETLEAGASLARVARRHAGNANHVFYWRKKYREGRLGKNQSSKLLPVTLSGISWIKKKWMQPVVEAAVPVPSISITPAFLNVEQAAGYFGVTTWTIRRLISTGKLVAKQIGKRFIVKRSDLDVLWENEAVFGGKKKTA